MRTGTSSHGSPLTCLVSLGNSLSTNSTPTPKCDLSSSRYGPSMKSAAEPSPRRCSVYSLQASYGQSNTPSGWQTQSWSRRKRDLEDVYRLHKLKQRLPEGTI